MEDIINVANYIMATKGITRGKVQNILYLAYAIYLAENNEEYSDNNMNILFEAEFEAWGKKEGIVNREIRDYMNGISNIQKLGINKNEIEFNDIKNKAFLDRIIRKYQRYSVKDLNKISGREDAYYYACIYPRLCGLWPEYVIRDKYIYDRFRKIDIIERRIFHSMEDVNDVAAYIKSKGSFTNVKVNIIMYYAYALFLVKYNDKYSKDMLKLFDGVFLASPDGPREIKGYIDKLKIKVRKDKNTQKLDNKKICLKEKQNEKFLDHVIAIYGEYSEEELKDMVKREEPWQNPYISFEGVLISKPEELNLMGFINNRVMYDYYYKKYMEEE